MQYLVDTYGKDDSIFPKDVKKRALINQKMDYDMGTLYQAVKNAYVCFLTKQESPIMHLFMDNNLTNIVFSVNLVRNLLSKEEVCCRGFGKIGHGFGLHRGLPC